MTEEERNRVKSEYLKGRNMRDLAKELNVDTNTIYCYIKRARSRGELPKIVRTYDKKKPKKIEVEEKLPPEGIKCTQAVARKCMYGTSFSTFLCDYYCKTGELRSHKSPDPEHCHCFKRRRKNNDN